jgi:hypothetical protein
VVKPGPYAGFALDEAKQGHPEPLIGRLRFFLQHGGEALSDGEIQFIMDALQATAGPRSADNLRKVEQFLIASHVERLTKEGNGDGKPLPRKAAVAEVMSQRHRSERHVKSALSAQGKKVK